MFRDRKNAGEQLAARLDHLKPRQPVVLALPRGGVAIGFEIALRLGALLDIVLVRKIGVPWQPELALGALADGDGGPPEVFIDEGDVDMVQALKTYRDVGYQGPIVSDHTPAVEGDTGWGHRGRTFSHGYMRALVQAVNAT